MFIGHREFPISKDRDVVKGDHGMLILLLLRLLLHSKVSVEPFLTPATIQNWKFYELANKQITAIHSSMAYVASKIQRSSPSIGLLSLLDIARHRNF